MSNDSNKKTMSTYGQQSMNRSQLDNHWREAVEREERIRTSHKYYQFNNVLSHDESPPAQLQPKTDYTNDQSKGKLPTRKLGLLENVAEPAPFSEDKLDDEQQKKVQIPNPITGEAPVTYTYDPRVPRDDRHYVRHNANAK